MTKNAVYFMLKALFVLEVLTFLYWRFGYSEKRPDKKAMLISNFMTSQTGPQIITIHILSNISRSKDNKAMKFGQLIVIWSVMKFVFILCATRGLSKYLKTTDHLPLPYKCFLQKQKTDQIYNN